jgi:hypothetical protein|tara:strand:+ start:1577 stop:1837 length:261 start_codon:yes stop_codon:yes gene_type:complete
MTVEEAKQLEVKIANNVLNNVPFAQVVQLLSGEATRRAKEIVDNSSEEELTKIKEDFEKSEAEAQAAQNQQQDKIDLPDEVAENKD